MDKSTNYRNCWFSTGSLKHHQERHNFIRNILREQYLIIPVPASRSRVWVLRSIDKIVYPLKLSESESSRFDTVPHIRDKREKRLKLFSDKGAVPIFVLLDRGFNFVCYKGDTMKLHEDTLNLGKTRFNAACRPSYQKNQFSKRDGKMIPSINVVKRLNQENLISAAWWPSIR